MQMMMEKTYKYGRMDGLAKFITSFVIVFVAMGITALFYFFGAMYMTIWVCVVVAILVSLFAISIPRKLILTEEYLEIRCMLETTFLSLDRIDSITTGRLHGMVCVWGSFGFFGYYGYYADLNAFLTRDGFLTKVYAKNRNNLLEITCEGKRYLIGCPDNESLVEELRKLISVGSETSKSE